MRSDGKITSLLGDGRLGADSQIAAQDDRAALTAERCGSIRQSAERRCRARTVTGRAVGNINRLSVRSEYAQRTKRKRQDQNRQKNKYLQCGKRVLLYNLLKLHDYPNSRQNSTRHIIQNS